MWCVCVCIYENKYSTCVLEQCIPIAWYLSAHIQIKSLKHSLHMGGNKSMFYTEQCSSLKKMLMPNFRLRIRSCILKRWIDLTITFALFKTHSWHEKQNAQWGSRANMSLWLWLGCWRVCGKIQCHMFTHVLFNLNIFRGNWLNTVLSAELLHIRTVTLKPRIGIMQLQSKRTGSCMRLNFFVSYISWDLVSSCPCVLSDSIWREWTTHPHLSNASKLVNR